MRRTKIVLIESAIIIIIALALASAITGSIGNARMTLYPEVGILGTTIEKTILVKNVNNISVNISLVANDDIKDIIEIIDDQFILQPDDEKKARFNIKLKKAGDYSGKINVFFTPIGEKGAGVALSSTITIHATKKGIFDDDNSTSEDNIEDEDLTDDNPTNPRTNSTIMNNEISPLTMTGISTAILLIILIVLLVILKKRGKLKRKRRVRSS